MLMAILWSAWGFMLQIYNEQRDCLFFQILATGKGDRKSALNVIPIRVTGEEDSTVEQIIRKQFRQLIISQSYESFNGEDLDAKNFNYFLNFEEQSGEINYVKTPAVAYGKVIYRDYRNSRGMDCGVYFRHTDKKLWLTFLYNEVKFAGYGIERLWALYQSVLKQMLFNWDSNFGWFMGRLKERVELQFRIEKISYANKNVTLREFFSQSPLIYLRGYSNKNS